MTPKEIKENLNHVVLIKGPNRDIYNSRYLLTACIIRKQEDDLVISAELQDLNNSRSILIEPIKNIYKNN